MQVAEQAHFDAFVFGQTIDQASPKLMIACASLQHFEHAEIEICRVDGDKQPYLEYKLSDVVVTAVRQSGGNSGDAHEELSLHYGKVEWTYTKPAVKPGVPTSKVTAGWDIARNEPI